MANKVYLNLNEGNIQILTQYFDHRIPLLNFSNILRAAFMRTDPECARNT